MVEVVVDNPTLNDVLANPGTVAGRPRVTLTDLLAACNTVRSTLTDELIKVPAPIDAPVLMTPEEAAEYLKMPETWVLDKARAGTIGTKMGLYWRFLRSELDDLLRKGCK